MPDTIWGVKKVTSDNDSIVITTTTANQLLAGNLVNIGGTNLCDGERWKIAEVVDTDKVRLANSGGYGTFDSEMVPPFPPVDPPAQYIEWLVNLRAIIGASNADPIVILTADEHLLEVNDPVTITDCEGNTAANVTNFVVTSIIDANRFELTGVAGNGSYSGNGILELL